MDTSVQPPLPEQAGQNNKLAIAAGALGLGGVALSLISAIVVFIFPPAVILLLFCFGISILMGIVGLILGIIALVQIKKNPGQQGKGLAVTGIVIGAIAVVLLCLSPVLVITILTLLGPIIGDVFSQINNSLSVP